MGNEMTRNQSSANRRWALRIGGGLLVLGVIAGGLSLPGKSVIVAQDSTDPKKNAEPTEEDIRRALEELKKGPPAKKEDKEREVPPDRPVRPARPADLADDVLQKQLELQKRIQEMLRKQEGGKPEDVEKELKQLQDEMNKVMENMARQLQIMPFQQFPGGGGRVIINRGGFGRPAPRLGDGRLGMRIEKPTPALVEQLDLPVGRGIVVTEMLAESAAAKAGIKTNDIILEIDGKPAPSEIQDFQQMVQEIKANAPVDIVVMRKGRKETIKGVKVPEAAPEEPNGGRRIPNLIPAIPFPNILPGLQGGLGQINGISVSRANDEFTVKLRDGGLSASVSGTMENGAPKVTSFLIDDNGTIVKGDSVEKIAERYQEIVNKMLRSVR